MSGARLPDIVDAVTRSRMMAGIRSKDTKPELLLRRALHRRGLRYRLHVSALPGKPDLVFPAKRAVLFAHGCFWHGHTCHLFRLPSTRQEFWEAKIAGNRAADSRALAGLLAAGWRVGVVWECSLKGKLRLPQEEVIDRCAEWLAGGEPTFELRGAIKPKP